MMSKKSPRNGHSRAKSLTFSNFVRQEQIRIHPGLNVAKLIPITPFTSKPN
jgi:hypothetical protein